jgi:hypothetical protein
MSWRALIATFSTDHRLLFTKESEELAASCKVPPATPVGQSQRLKQQHTGAD